MTTNDCEGTWNKQYVRGTLDLLYKPLCRTLGALMQDLQTIFINTHLTTQCNLAKANFTVAAH